MRNDNTNLPTQSGNGDDDQQNIIQGTISRCVDGHWSDRDKLPIPSKLLALATTQAVQRFREGERPLTITKRPLPDVAKLNAEIPEDEWELGIDGKPRPPWVLQYVVYLLDPNDASPYTFINHTTGAAIAVEQLSDRIRLMRLMRGSNVVPLVLLDSKPMKTKFGTKQRPEFKVAEWRELGGGGEIEQQATPQLEHKATAGKPVKPVSVGEELNDKIPF
jgi:hypothetical protein